MQNETATIEIQGRQWNLTKQAPAGPATIAENARLGFEAEHWNGVSLPKPGQRKTFLAIFNRRITGEFLCTFKVSE